MSERASKLKRRLALQEAIYDWYDLNNKERPVLDCEEAVITEAEKLISKINKEKKDAVV